MRLVSMVCLAVCQIWTGPAVADEGMTASNGAHLPMPDIAALDCVSMDALLIVYSAADYRGTASIPEEHPDRALYDYEDALAEHHYLTCQAGAASYGTPVEAFGQGFN